MYNKEVAARYYRKNKERIKEVRIKYRINNKESIRIKQNLYRKKHGRHRSDYSKENSRKYNLKSMYNISIEEYDLMCLKQGNACAICQKIHIKRLVIDHCHTTGKVRGLLCNNCNSGIGFLQENIEVMKNAILYLKR